MTGKITGKITGTGAYVPENILDNEDIAKLVDTSDAWIRERTGVVRRHIVSEDTTVSMAVKAAERALENAGIQAGEIDLILVSTLSSNVILPSTACEVQRAIHADHAACFDLNAACTGFLFAYNTVQTYMQSGLCKKALVIGAETLSDLIDWTDRGTCILFGDGAGAAVIEAAEGNGYPMIMHSDGGRGDALFCRNRIGKGRENAEADHVRMDGKAVFQFAVRQVPEVIRELLDAAEMAAEEIDWFILHQANQRIISAVAKRLKAGIEKFPMNLMEYGNTSSASIPILLDEMNRDGRLKKGQKVIMAGFGGGLSWGASLLNW